MNDLYLLAGFLFAYAGLHSLLAAQRIKHRLEGHWPHLARSYRLAYTIVSVITLWPLVLFLAASPNLYRVTGYTAYALRILQVIGGIGFLASLRAIDLGIFLGYRRSSENETTPPSPTEPALTTDGPYGLCRHPVYFFASLFLVAQPTVSEGYAVFTIWTVTYFWLGSWMEERRFIRDLGDTYLQYRAHVPHFIPLPRKRKTSSSH